MNFLVDTSNRSSKMEIMDDFTMKGVMFRDALDKLEIINRLLGGNRVTIEGLKELLKNQSKNKVITIVDLGCGHGDILRDIAKFGRKSNYSFKLIGIDANFAAIEYAKELSKEYNLSIKGHHLEHYNTHRQGTTYLKHQNCDGNNCFCMCCHDYTVFQSQVSVDLVDGR